LERIAQKATEERKSQLNNTNSDDGQHLRSRQSGSRGRHSAADVYSNNYPQLALVNKKENQSLKIEDQEQLEASQNSSNLAQNLKYGGNNT
jgi:hypothetical protein